MPKPADYRPPPRPRRSAATWIILGVVWIVGIVIWAIYFGLALLLLFKLLG